MPLSVQEVRSFILIMVNRVAYFWVESLSKYDEFAACAPIPERLALERYDVELVLRFVLLHNIGIEEVSQVSDLSQFLTSKMRLEFADVDMEFLNKIGDIFNRTFLVLFSACGDNALRKFDVKKGKFGGPFLISAFELVALGVAWNIDFVESKAPSWLEEKIKAIWSDEGTEGIYGQGVSTARRLPRTLALGRRFFSE